MHTHIYIYTLNILPKAGWQIGIFDKEKGIKTVSTFLETIKHGNYKHSRKPS